jgi:glycosyltransferase involved in cell wall biosynthesis
VTAVTGTRSAPVVALDASRNRSGGAKAHLLGLLRAGDPRPHGVSAVHVWSYQGLLRELPDEPWLVKHGAADLERGLPQQLWWQYRRLPDELERAGCDLLLSTDAGTVCRFEPSVVMSRDMLSFEDGEMQRYGLASFARWRLELLKHMQVSSLRRSEADIFLTEYASGVIQRFTGPLPRTRVIPHGISEHFRRAPGARPSGDGIRCVYVSNADLYKHQWHVVRAVARLRSAGHAVTLRLVGGGGGRGQALLDAALAEVDPDRRFVELVGAVRHDDIPVHLAGADVFVFASSCENMPNTLIEAMAASLPIACSNRGPMPEVLQDAGVYFDPEDPASIAAALERLVVDPALRASLAEKAHALACRYSWRRCAEETWRYLAEVWRDRQARRDGAR